MGCSSSTPSGEVLRSIAVLFFSLVDLCSSFVRILYSFYSCLVERNYLSSLVHYISLFEFVFLFSVRSFSSSSLFDK
jgi:hypothetical protein